MVHKNKKGLTLIELIVAIAILAILGTIAYISLAGYTKDARNSSRISDVNVIRKALNLFFTVEGVYPLPDEFTYITYSGARLWSQGHFGTRSAASTERISEAPVDPLFNVPYSYSVLGRGDKYQLGSVVESAGLFSQSNPLVETTYALSNSDVGAYVTGTYTEFDVAVKSGTGCTSITAPSLLLQSIPSGNTFTQGGTYNFVDNDTPNFPATYSGQIDEVVSGTQFTIAEVLNKCEISNLGELEVYIAKLSTTFEQLSDNQRYQQVVFNSQSNDFRETALHLLEENELTVSDDLIQSIRSPAPYFVYTDTFNGTDSTQITNGHASTTASGSWSVTSGGIDSSYVISNNRMTKADGAASGVSITPLPVLTLSGSVMNFDVVNFAGGSVYAYLRYTDANNYYGVDLSTTGYRVLRANGGAPVELANFVEAIPNTSSIRFGVEGDIISLSINNVDKGSIFAGGVDEIGQAAIFMENAGAQIDNYSLTYQ